MLFEWDAAKDRANIHRHGISFDEAIAIFTDQAHVVLDTTREADGERREKIVGLIGTPRGPLLFVVVFTMRGNKCRFISARRANESEENAYANHRP